VKINCQFSSIIKIVKMNSITFILVTLLGIVAAQQQPPAVTPSPLPITPAPAAPAAPTPSAAPEPTTLQQQQTTTMQQETTTQVTSAPTTLPSATPILTVGVIQIGGQQQPGVNVPIPSLPVPQVIG
jgi:hypothetical protein